VTDMNSQTFMNHIMTIIEIDEDNAIFEVRDGFVFNRERNSIVRYISGEVEVFVENDISRIEPGCFCYRGDVERIDFESGSRISIFTENAFERCLMLTSIVIPCAVEIIAEFCFAFCGNLRQVTFESGSRLSSLGYCSFSYCSSLESICFPASVTSIYFSCFTGCRRLTTVLVENDTRISFVASDAFSGCPPWRQLPSSFADLI
jgi:hypothetical protein